MTREELSEALGLDESALFMDGFDDCVLGACHLFARPVVVAYDLEKVLAKLVSQGCGREEAEEFWAFNQLGSWVGDGTPVFIAKVEG